MISPCYCLKTDESLSIVWKSINQGKILGSTSAGSLLTRPSSNHHHQRGFDCVIRVVINVSLRDDSAKFWMNESWFRAWYFIVPLSTKRASFIHIVVYRAVYTTYDHLIVPKLFAKSSDSQWIGHLEPTHDMEWPFMIKGVEKKSIERQLRTAHNHSRQFSRPDQTLNHWRMIINEWRHH